VNAGYRKAGAINNWKETEGAGDKQGGRKPDWKAGGGITKDMLEKFRGKPHEKVKVHDPGTKQWENCKDKKRANIVFRGKVWQKTEWLPEP